MGVQGLWELLAPVGRRVSVETLAGKRLAIDASIWMVQFIKAMRDEKGDMVHNAHLIGFFRRICKLLFLRTKPVFVFDGGTPALKRRTVIARRRQRENAQTKIRKTAEKLLLNRLKDMRLKEQAKDIKNQRLQQNSTAREKKKHVSSESVQEKLRDSAEKADVGGSSLQEGKLDEISSASMVGENGVDDAINKGGSQKCDRKGKGVLLDGDDLDNKMRSNIEQDSSVFGKDYQEKLDEMLAASLAAEEDGNFTSKASTSVAAFLSEEEGSDEDEQILLPAVDGNVDPAVLASLPPSMQLDLLVQMRERLMAENRQKYQKVKKAPEKFSELQIEAYLKTVAFRREINEVQRTAGGRAVGGVQTSRIASEANREFIFSSSFSGDKEVLASAREGGNGGNQKNTSQPSVPFPIKSVSTLNKSDDTIDLDRDEPTNPDETIEVYMDERGRLRIRNRHMGIQMTRDIQRNLHLMKEKERTTFGSMSNNDETVGIWENFPPEDQFLETLPREKGDLGNLEKWNDDSMLPNPSSIEISFEHDGGGKDLDDEDDMFLQLAAGGSVPINSTENDPKENSSPWASDSDWEEISAEQDNVVSNLDVSSSNQHIPADISTNEGAAKEETTCANDARNSMDNNTVKKFSKGYLEEEADLQEAIQKSLLHLHRQESGDILLEENKKIGVNIVVEKPTQDSLCSSETVDEAEEEGTQGGISIFKTSDATQELSCSSVADNADDRGRITKQFGTDPSSGSDNVRRAVSNEMPQVKPVILPEKALNVASESCMLSTTAKQHNKDGSESFVGKSVEVSAMTLADEERTGFLGGTSIRRSVEKGSADGDLSTVMEDKRDCNRHKSQSPVTESRDPSRDASRSHIGTLYDTDSLQEIRNENNSNERSFNIENSTHLEEKGVPVEFSEADLEEEMRFLDQEYVSLGDEQRKLERNAESVSSEMFAECQELLQMFGLPYIIAPMEAEAQCAFMEQSNLVDGIVTDDSDVFLFGARSVYKNIFDDRKYVETYFMKDIEKELGLSRDKIIRMAMLLGSDYTEGISGIGIVNAIEVVTAFPEEDGLQKFREWVESPDPTILGKSDTKTGLNVKKHGSDCVDNVGSISEEIKKIFMDKHRKVSKNWHIPSTFPSEAVTSAYLNPQVDRSSELFSWGKPDLSVLRKLCWEKFGWNSQKTDDLLLPVLKEYEKRETQLRMEAFYSFSERFAKIRSKRIKKAVEGIGGGLSSEVADHTLQEGPRNGNKKRLAPHKTEDSSSDKDSGEKEKNQKDHLGKSSSRSSDGNKRGRGRGGTQKRGRGRGRGRGRRNLVPELSDGTSDDDDDDNKVVDLQASNDAKPGHLQKVRRSTRTRNPVDYVGEENDKLEESKGKGESPSEDLEDDEILFAERKQNETTADASINECPHDEYNQMGGGFCADEAEIGDAHLENNKETSDYRVIGGGFCVDEDETGEEDTEIVNMESEEHQNKAKRRNEDASLDENVEIEIGNSSAGGLSAMPFLKRKKRKS